MWLSPEMSRSAMGPSLVWVARSLGGLGDGVKALPEEVAHRRVPAELHRTLKGSPCLCRPSEPLEEVPSERPVRLVTHHLLGWNGGECRESGLGASGLAEGGGVTHAGADGRRKVEQSLVQQRNRLPVGVIRDHAPCVH